LREGDTCPDFTLPSTEGEFRLSERLGKGRYIILYFYPKDDTPGCRAEACSFRDSLNTIAGMDAEVYGISTDGLESHRRFAAKHGLNFPLLSDRGGVVARLFDAYNGVFKTARRKTFIVSPDGRVVKIVEGVKPEEHAREVIEFLRGLR